MPRSRLDFHQKHQRRHRPSAARGAVRLQGEQSGFRAESEDTGHERRHFNWRLVRQNVRPFVCEEIRKRR